MDRLLLIKFAYPNVSCYLFIILRSTQTTQGSYYDNNSRFIYQKKERKLTQRNRKIRTLPIDVKTALNWRCLRSGQTEVSLLTNDRSIRSSWYSLLFIPSSLFPYLFQIMTCGIASTISKQTDPSTNNLIFIKLFQLIIFFSESLRNQRNFTFSGYLFEARHLITFFHNPCCFLFNV